MAYNLETELRRKFTFGDLFLCTPHGFGNAILFTQNSGNKRFESENEKVWTAGTWRNYSTWHI